MAYFASFETQTYLNLETFRKNGLGVKTPVWFVLDGDSLFVRTGAGSGKVKRARRNGQVNVAPCKANGELLGDWLPARAREIGDPEINRRVDHLLDRKYGLLKKLFALFSALQGQKYTLLEITPGK